MIKILSLILIVDLTLTSIQYSLVISCTHHVLCDLTGPVPGLFPALLLGDDRHSDLHENICRLTTFTLLAPAYYSGVVTIITPVHCGQTHWPHIVIELNLKHS